MPVVEPATAENAAAPTADTIPYNPVLAKPEPKLETLLLFRSIHPLYGAYLVEHLGLADQNERLQALESALELPRAVLRHVRVPGDVGTGPLAMGRLDEELIRRGLMIAPVPEAPGEEEEDDGYEEKEEHPPSFADKLFLLFQARFPDVDDVKVQSAWCAGEVLRFGGNFNKYVQSRDLVKQEGIVFRHLLRLILLCEEFAQAAPPDATATAWQADLREIAERLTECCRTVDPASTEEIIQQSHAADVVEGETLAAKIPNSTTDRTDGTDKNQA